MTALASESAEVRGERVAAYVLERVRVRAPHSWRQARRGASQAPNGPGCLDTFHTFHINGIPELAFGGLMLVERGFPVVLTDAALSPDTLLGLQARGTRCVTLLPPGTDAPAPHTDGLDFALHDLCHLAKFADAEHHAGQVGFFRSLSRAFADPDWRGVESGLDETWRADRAAVSADMNGSCVYLLAVLKMRLRMAARRRLARSRGVPAPSSGPATPEEDCEFSQLFGVLLDALDLPGEVRSAAITTNARRDDAVAARRLIEYFEGDMR